MRKHVKSYKQLPINLFQIQTKFRDEIRPRFGLMRGREFIMKDGYSFHVDDADADREYWRMFRGFTTDLQRLGVNFRPVEADSGAIGGSFTHEFHVLAGSGEDAILSCNRVPVHVECRENRSSGHAVSLRVGTPPRPEACDFHTPGVVADGAAGQSLSAMEAIEASLRPRVEVLSLRARKGEVGVGRRTRPPERPRAEYREDEEPHWRRFAHLVPLEEAERTAPD